MLKGIFPPFLQENSLFSADEHQKLIVFLNNVHQQYDSFKAETLDFQKGRVTALAFEAGLNLSQKQILEALKPDVDQNAIINQQTRHIHPAYKIGCHMALSYIAGLYFPGAFSAFALRNFVNLVLPELIGDNAKIASDIAFIMIDQFFSQYSPRALTNTYLPILEEHYGKSVYLVPPLLTWAYQNGRPYLISGAKTIGNLGASAYEHASSVLEAATEFSDSMYGLNEGP